MNSDGVVYWIPAVHINVDCSREGFVPPGTVKSYIFISTKGSIIILKVKYSKGRGGQTL